MTGDINAVTTIRARTYRLADRSWLPRIFSPIRGLAGGFRALSYTLKRAPPTSSWSHSGTRPLILLDRGLRPLVDFCSFEKRIHPAACSLPSRPCCHFLCRTQLRTALSPKKSYIGCPTMANLQPEDPFLQVQAYAAPSTQH
jgi:hypothetical protein